MPNDSTASPLLTESEAAHQLGCSLSTLRRWRRAGTGPRFFHLGNILRYRSEDLDAFVALHLQQQEVA